MFVLPSLVGKIKKTSFQHVKNRIWSKLQSWWNIPQSKARRENLIKSCAQAIPTYYMSVFLMPSSLAEEPEKMINFIWWGSKGNEARCLNWLSWSKLFVRKEFGRLGFRDYQTFNLAMLGKQGWKFLSNPNALVTRIFKAKYFSDGFSYMLVRSIILVIFGEASSALTLCLRLVIAGKLVMVNP